MGMRNFFRVLLRGAPPERPPRHGGHDIAETARETLGPASGGSFGGRVTGSAVYKHLEKTVGPNHPESD